MTRVCSTRRSSSGIIGLGWVRTSTLVLGVLGGLLHNWMPIRLMGNADSTGRYVGHVQPSKANLTCHLIHWPVYVIIVSSGKVEHRGPSWRISSPYFARCKCQYINQCLQACHRYCLSHPLVGQVQANRVRGLRATIHDRWLDCPFVYDRDRRNPVEARMARVTG